MAYNSRAPASERLSHERRADQDAAVRHELERPRLQPFVSVAELERQPVDEALHRGRNRSRPARGW